MLVKTKSAVAENLHIDQPREDTAEPQLLESEKPVEDVQTEQEVEDDTDYPRPLVRSLLILGISCAAFLVALDRTIIAAAIPRITDVFKSPGDAGWYGSAYLLTSCACQPTFGRVFTNFDTRMSFLTALGLFELGSLICGAAPNSTALIVGRAIAGIGCAGIFAGCMLIITKSVPLAKRPVYMAGVGGIFGIGSISGPVIGGAFTDRVSWRMIFYLNLPVGAITAVIVLLFFPATKEAEKTEVPFIKKLLQLDIFGNFLLITSVAMLLLALQWGGLEYPWRSAKIVGLLVGSVVEICIFIWWMIYRGPIALIPPKIVTQRTVAACLAFSFLISGTVLVHSYYVPYWFQTIKNVSAEKSGVNMVPYVLSNFVFSIIAGAIVQKSGYVLPAAMVSPIVASIGSGLMMTFAADTSTVKWAGYSILAGAGIGIGMQQGVVAVQAVLPKESIPIGTSMILFTQSLSGAIFVSVGNSILRNELSSGLTTAKLPGIDVPQVLAAGATVVRQLIPVDQLQSFVTIYNESIQKVFLIAVPLAATALLPAVFIEWKSLKRTSGVTGEA